MATFSVRACVFPVEKWLANATNTPDLHSVWHFVPHGVYRASHGAAWHYMRDEDDLLELVSDQDQVYIYHHRRDRPTVTLSHFTIDLDAITL